MTLIDAVNKVLRGLREDTVASLSAKRSQHIAQLVNEAKEDVEDAGPWYALRTTIDDTLTPSTSTLVLTATNARSYLLFVKNLPQAFITTVDEERRLDVVEAGELDALYSLNPDAQENVPCAVAFIRGADGLTARFFPTPDQAYTVRLVVVIPQDDLDDAEDELSVPDGPVWREALARAMEERGEDFAGPIDRAFARSRQALGDAMMRDFGADEMTFEAQ